MSIKKFEMLIIIAWEIFKFLLLHSKITGAILQEARHWHIQRLPSPNKHHKGDTMTSFYRITTFIHTTTSELRQSWFFTQIRPNSSVATLHSSQREHTYLAKPVLEIVQEDIVPLPLNNFTTTPPNKFVYTHVQRMDWSSWSVQKKGGRYVSMCF